MEEKKALIKETDLLNSVNRIISKLKFILVVTFCFAVFGIVIALSSVRSYTAEVVVAPETAGSSFLNSGFGSLASAIGMDFGMGDGGEALYPLLYPDIVTSLPFLTSLFSVKVECLSANIDTTYYVYLKEYSERTWLDDVRKFPKDALNKIMSLFKAESGSKSSPDFNPYKLSKKQMNLVKELNSNISIFVDKKTNVISLSFTDRDPLVAAIMVDTITSRLQQIIVEYRTKKANDDCNYIESLYWEAKDSMEVAQKRYADFVDGNRNVTKETVLIEKERLMADKELKTTLFSQWAQQLQLAKAKVQEKTPVFVTLKPAAVPADPSSMGRMMRVMLYAFLGFVFAVAYVLMKEPVRLLWFRIIRKSK